MIWASCGRSGGREEAKKKRFLGRMEIPFGVTRDGCFLPLEFCLCNLWKSIGSGLLRCLNTKY